MTAVTQTDSDFAFAGLDTPEAMPAAAIRALGTPDPLGALAGLEGTWKGHGFNAIWRPHNPPSQDRFLELNMTDETLVFTPINGPIPNRGLAMHDINMFGLTYMQQISETSTGAGLHIEPGIWANVPHTTDPNLPPSVVRMASIPHGTVVLAQGVAEVHPGGPQNIPDNNILPFFFGSPPPANSDFNSVAQTFTELKLSTPTSFRFVAPGVTQQIVKNPNSVLQTALQTSLQGTSMKSRTFLNVSTTHNIVKAGGGHCQHRLPGVKRQSPRRQREGRAGQRHLLDRDDRWNRRSARQAPAAVHAAGDARLQRDSLAARHGRDAAEAVAHP